MLIEDLGGNFDDNGDYGDAVDGSVSVYGRAGTSVATPAPLIANCLHLAHAAAIVAAKCTLR